MTWDQLTVLSLIIILAYFAVPIFNIIRRKMLRNLALEVIESLNKENVDYWIDFGTLLGIIREDDIILGDNDVDIIVVESNELADKMKKVRRDLLSKNINVERMNWSAYRAYNPFACDMYINTRNDKDNMYIGATGETSNISYDLIGTPKYITWRGVEVRVPEFIEKVLVYRYGENWKTPIPKNKGRNHSW